MCTHTSVNHNYVIFVALCVHLNKIPCLSESAAVLLTVASLFDLSSLVMCSRMRELLVAF